MNNKKLRDRTSASQDSSRPTRTIPERDAAPVRGLTPPQRRTPETAEMKELTSHRRVGVNTWSRELIAKAVRESFVKLW